MTLFIVSGGSILRALCVQPKRDIEREVEAINLKLFPVTMLKRARIDLACTNSVV